MTISTIKSYTDIKQSKKLAEILPIDSADMYYPNRIDIKYQGALPIEYKHGNPLLSQEIAAWSLAALLDILPNNENISTNLSKGGYKISALEYTNSWFVDYEDETNYLNNCVTSADNPVDACYELILKLYELNLL